MSAATGSRLAWSLWSLTLLGAVAAVLLVFANRPMPTGQLLRDGLLPSVVAITYCGAGAFIAARRPRNWIGWILILFGLAFAVGELGAEYAVRALVTAPGSLPGGRAAAWLQVAAGAPVFTVLLPLLVLLFPDGRLPSRRWRPLAWLIVAAGLASVVLTTLARIPLVSGFRHVPLGPNPLGVVPLTTDAAAALGVVEIAILVAAAAATIVRLVRSRGVERQQLQWLALVGAATLIAIGVSDVLGGGLVGQIATDVMIALITVGFPAAIVVAVLRYRLLDVDVVIHRSLVYGALAVFITVAYVGVVTGVGGLVGIRGRPNLAISILTTAVVAVAFQPARQLLQRFANRLVYGRRASPYEAMSELSHKMAGAASVEEVLPGMAELAARAVGAPGGRARLVLPGDVEVGSVWPAGADPTAPATGVAVIDRGERVGEIDVLQVPGEGLTRSQEVLLADLAAQAGPALRGVRLTAELRGRVAEIAGRAQQLRASRARLVTAAEAQRRRLDTEIQAGPRRLLEVISGRLDEAVALLRGDPTKAGDLLGRLADQVQEALDVLRDLARGIFPPLLAERGLEPALRSHLRKMAPAAELEVAPEVAGRRFDPDVEAAFYFGAVEALQHAARSRPEARHRIRLTVGDGWLELTAPQPDGEAFDDVADRVEAIGGTIEAGPGARFVARVPLTPAALPA